MGDADERGGLLDGHVFAIDVMGPHVADALLTIKIVLGDAFHRNRVVLKKIDLPLGHGLRFNRGIDHHERQDAKHDEYVDEDYPNSLHIIFYII